MSIATECGDIAGLVIHEESDYRVMFTYRGKHFLGEVAGCGEAFELRNKDSMEFITALPTYNEMYATSKDMKLACVVIDTIIEAEKRVTRHKKQLIPA